MQTKPFQCGIPVVEDLYSGAVVMIAGKLSRYSKVRALGYDQGPPRLLREHGLRREPRDLRSVEVRARGSGEVAHLVEIRIEIWVSQEPTTMCSNLSYRDMASRDGEHETLLFVNDVTNWHRRRGNDTPVLR